MNSVKPVRKSTFTGMMKILEGIDKSLIELHKQQICFMQVMNENNFVYYRGSTVKGDFHGIGEIFHANGE